MTDTYPRRSVLAIALSAAGAVLAACSGAAKSPRPSTSTTSAAPPSPETSSPTASSSTTSAATAPAPTADRLGKGPFNVLVIGSDSRSSTSFAGNSDVITVAQITGDRRRVNLVSIARDCYVALPEGGHGKINASYPEAGAAGLARTVSGVLGGLPVHATLETGFTTFTRLVDQLGGVVVQNRFRSDSSHVVFRPGPVRLNGTVALTYVRERHGLPNGDLDRTERHRATLTAILDKLAAQARSNPGQLARLVPTLMRNVRARGLTTTQALSLIPAVSRLSRADVSSVIVPVSHFDTISGASVDVVDQARTAELSSALKKGDLSGYVKRYGTSDAPTG